MIYKILKGYELFSSKLIRLLKLFKLNQAKTSKETSKQTSNDKTKQGKRNEREKLVQNYLLIVFHIPTDRVISFLQF